MQTMGPSMSDEKNCIQLASCSESQLLPMNPELPADLFTACLTTPIKIALQWFCHQRHGSLVPAITLSLIEKLAVIDFHQLFRYILMR